jgi:hypothetical protein
MLRHFRPRASSSREGRGSGLIKFIRVPGEGSAFIYNKKKFLTNENKIEICVLVGGLWRRESP